jgi:diguanylate cyclase (GGDEF)-like protein
MSLKKPSAKKIKSFIFLVFGFYMFFILSMKKTYSSFVIEDLIIFLLFIGFISYLVFESKLLKHLNHKTKNQSKKQIEMLIEAYKDELTKTHNRKTLKRWFHIKSKIIDSEKKDMSIIYFDIDDFKYINDNYGHQSGDEVLKKLCFISERLIPQYALFSRIGGDEFCILIPENTIIAEMIAENIKRAIYTTVFHNKFSITCSFGISSYVNGDTLESFLDKGDRAMYKSKLKGKNCIAILD